MCPLVNIRKDLGEGVVVDIRSRPVEVVVRSCSEAYMRVSREIRDGSDMIHTGNSSAATGTAAVDLRILLGIRSLGSQTCLTDAVVFQKRRRIRRTIAFLWSARRRRKA